MTNDLPGSGRLVSFDMAVPSVGLTQAPNWRGSSMEPLTVVPIVSGFAFHAHGTGVFPLGNTTPGGKGTLEILLRTAVPVVGIPATGFIVTVAEADLVDGETFELDDGVNPPTTFEFDSDAMVVMGNVAVTINMGDTVDQVKDAIIAAVNGVGAGLAITAGDGGAGLVTLVNDAVGAAGNVAIVENVANMGFIVSGMSGGVTPGPERTVCYLTDNPAAPTKYLLVAVDEANRPIVKITNSAGVVIADVTPSGPTLNSGTLSIRFSWDAKTAISGGFHASLLVNGTAIPVMDWTVDPNAPWTHFKPTHLVVGAGLGASDFNGTVSSIQVSNLVL